MSKHCSQHRFLRPQSLTLFSLAIAMLMVLGLTPEAASSKAALSTPTAAEHHPDQVEPAVKEAPAIQQPATDEAHAEEAQKATQKTALAEYNGKVAEYAAAAADQEKKAKELAAIIEEDNKKAEEHTSAAASLEEKATLLATTAAEQKEKKTELAAAAADEEKKAAELTAIAADHQEKSVELKAAAAEHEKKAAEIAAAAAGHKEKAAELADRAASQEEKAKELNLTISDNKEKAAAEAAAAANLEEKIKELTATAASHEKKAKELVAFVASLEKKARELNEAALTSDTSAETTETEISEPAKIAPVVPIREGKTAAKLERGQISKADLRKFQVIFFGIGFLISLFFLLSPMFLPSYRSVGSPSEIIEETGLGTKNTDGKKVLVAYDTRHGTTATTAQKMGKMLAHKGCQVDVRCLKNIMEEDISSYDAYLVGSWIYYMGISMATVEFLKRFKDQLTSKPTAYFVVCGKLLTGSEEEVGAVVRTYIQKAETEVPELKPIDLGMFPGGVVLNKLSFWERMQMHIKMRKLTEPRMKEGVFIDDNLLDEWTTKIVGLIK